MKSYPFIPVLILAAVLGISACSSSEEGFAPDTAQTTMILDTVGETTLPSPTPTPTPTPLPPAEEIAAMEPKTVTVSFVGDLTLTEDARSSSSIGFNAVVGDDYEYCFQNCKDIFLADDLTLGNLENAVTDLTSYAQKEFVFKMKPEALEMLQIAGIEAVNIANNHTKDFKLEGLEDTRDNLDEYGIIWSDADNVAIYETPDGIKIGMFGIGNSGTLDQGKACIDELKEMGANIIIASCHWGVEKMYTPNNDQISLAYGLIDYGADIVIGTHPHRLQPIEEYNGKYICYSLSNFCFGGNNILSDPDSCIIQCTFIMDSEGQSCVDYKLSVIPYSQTSTRPGNDFCPAPYEWGTEEYYRVLSKLGWSNEDE